MLLRFQWVLITFFSNDFYFTSVFWYFFSFKTVFVVVFHLNVFRQSLFKPSYIILRLNYLYYAFKFAYTLYCLHCECVMKKREVQVSSIANEWRESSATFWRGNVFKIFASLQRVFVECWCWCLWDRSLSIDKCFFLWIIIIGYHCIV